MVLSPVALGRQLTRFKIHLDLQECDRPASASYLTHSSVVLVFKTGDCLSFSSGDRRRWNFRLKITHWTISWPVIQIRSRNSISFSILDGTSMNKTCSHTSRHQTQWSDSNFHPVNSWRFFFARPMGCENIISTESVM